VETVVESHAPAAVFYSWPNPTLPPLRGCTVGATFMVAHERFFRSSGVMG